MPLYSLSPDTLLLTESGYRRAHALPFGMRLVHPDGSATTPAVDTTVERLRSLETRYGYRVRIDAPTLARTPMEVDLHLADGPHGEGGDVDIAFLHGVYAGAGMGTNSASYAKSVGFYLNSARQDLIRDVTEAVHSVLETVPEVHRNSCRTPRFTHLESGGARLISAPLYAALVTPGGETPQRRRLPTYVLAASREVQVAWLRGFLRTDGGFITGPAGRPIVSVSITDPILAYDLQTLLATFDIHVTVYVSRYDANGNPHLWVLRVTRREDMARIHELFDWGEYHEARWNAMRGDRPVKSRRKAVRQEVSVVSTSTDAEATDAITIVVAKPVIANGIVLH